ncbi:c-type cytochrome [Gilvimarinus sp. F26214L]|uniref:c-type cytochrome n=1 Tax=Gilvimarinus sp. DZF01 TaxID=3461371 RepID=UPI0040461469
MKRVVAGFAAVALMAAAAVAVADSRTDAIAERLAPVGEVCMAGEECTGGTTVVAASEARDPAEIYQSKCSSCHNSGVGGAPKLGDAAAWEPRIAKGMDVLFENAWNGFNAMPPRGICMDCSEQEIRETVEYMVQESS